MNIAGPSSVQTTSNFTLNISSMQPPNHFNIPKAEVFQQNPTERHVEPPSNYPFLNVANAIIMESNKMKEESIDMEHNSIAEPTTNTDSDLLNIDIQQLLQANSADLSLMSLGELNSEIHKYNAQQYDENMSDSRIKMWK